MADDQSSNNDKQALAAAYSKFYAGPGQQLDIQTKGHIEAPEIKAALPRAKAGEDVVSDREATTLSGRETHVYRPDPLGPQAPSQQNAFDALFQLLDRKVLGRDWSAADQVEADRQIKKLAEATGVDQNQVEAMAKRYEKVAAKDNEAIGRKFGPDPQTPLDAEIAGTLRKKAFGDPVTEGEEQKLQANLAQFAKDQHYSPAAVQEEVAMFQARAHSDFGKRHVVMAEEFDAEAQQIHTGRGEAFIYGDGIEMDKNRAAVPKMDGANPKAALAAWYVNPDDPPPNKPPGGAALGEFLISLHEAEHLSRRGDAIAPKTMSSDAQEQAGEIDADRAVLKFLDDQKDTASKKYWLEARHVDSFTAGVISGDTSHDTATFLRVQEATGQQLDLDKFNEEKRGLLMRIVAKGDFKPINDDYGRARTADVMGAVQDVLNDDKNEKDPANKLSPLQRAEAESFLKDAEAMGYKANPDYPRHKAAAAGPAPARPGTSAPLSSRA